MRLRAARARAAGTFRWVIAPIRLPAVWPTADGHVIAGVGGYVGLTGRVGLQVAAHPVAGQQVAAWIEAPTATAVDRKGVGA